ncbi:hypothetical protein AB0K43_30680 [Kitasatospora sp. NPDC049258]|uniref:hypothetical protein n=1 Tax=Kitasatospora sp. NPDC049258 TaxID=3155394 RepID=UPI00341EE617
MSSINDTALRFAVGVRQLTSRASRHLHTRVEALRGEPDRGDINIPTVIWIVGSVVFAVAALAVFNALADKHLSDMKGL